MFGEGCLVAEIIQPRLHPFALHGASKPVPDDDVNPTHCRSVADTTSRTPLTGTHMDAEFSLPMMLPKLMGILVAIVAILLPAIILYIVLHYRARRTEQLFTLVKQLSEKGLPVPPELIDPPANPGTSSSPFFRAVTLIGVGVGLAVMFYTFELKELMGIGALLGCIGIAQLIALRIEKPKS
jgi:hypothetical protein